MRGTDSEARGAPAAGLTEAGLLQVWEAALDWSPVRRSVALAALAADATPATIAGLPLGRRNALLLELRERCFGPALPGSATCPSCQTPLDVTVTTDELRAAPADSTEPTESAKPTESTVDELTVAGTVVTCRPLTAADLIAVEASATVDGETSDPRQALLRRCVVRARDVGTQDLPPAALPDAVWEAVAQRLPILDPLADLLIPLDCPECGHRWRAAFDIAGYVWAEFEAYARRLMHEVHALASAYGWTEADVLAVSPQRRRWYLEASAA